MSIAAVLGLLLGASSGALLAGARQRRRTQSLHVELAVLKAQVKAEEQIERERQVALERTVERLKSAFDGLAGASLRSNGELFLKLAREHLLQHQQSAVSALHEREKAIDALVAPIRDALGCLSRA